MASPEAAAALAAIAEELAAKKAAIAAGEAQEKATIAATLAEEKAAIDASNAAKKAALASQLVQEKAGIQAAAQQRAAALQAQAAQDKAVAQSRLQQEKSIQQAILAAQKNAANASAASDKRAHDQRMAEIKSEAALRMQAAKQAAAAQSAKPTVPKYQAPSSIGGLNMEGSGGVKGILSGALGGGIVGGLGAGLLITAATKLIEGAEKLAEAAVQLTISAVQLGIAETSKKEVQSAAMKKLGGDYDQTVKMALKLGIDPDDAVAQTKKLLNAGFANKEIPVLMRIKAGMDLAGLDGDALLKKLETIKLEPKVKSKDIDGLAKMGVDTKKVYEQLGKQMGVTSAVAMAKVKAGAVDSAQVVKAIETVQAAKFGPLTDILGNSVPALLTRVKVLFAEVFSSFDLKPLKDALKNIGDALEGPEGKAMKAAAGEAGTAIIEAIAGPLKGSEGRARLQQFAAEFIATMRAIKGAAEAARPAIKALMDSIASGKAFKDMDAAERAAQFKRKAIGGGASFAGAFGGEEGGGVAGKVKGLIPSGGGSPLDALQGMDFAPMNDTMADKGAETGKALPDGMVEGINDGSGEAVGAAVAMAERVLMSVKARLGQHSPSTEFAEVGYFGGEGMAKGFASNDNASRAAAGMAGRAVDAARGAAGAPGAPGAGGAGGRGAGGGPITIILQIGAGASPATVAALAQQQPMIEAAVRRALRDAGEGRAA